MKNLLFSLFALLSFFSAKAQEIEKLDKTLSPYFFVKSKDSKTDQMPLKHTSAEVNIAGVIADVKVKQIYQNTGKNTLEAIYVFPGSTRAAVYGMTMTIGERKLVAKIEEKQKARADYEQAKQEGKTASLLEQHNPNVFQMNVANILPGDSITVELRYTELLVPSEGIYEFAYPTVVGPRYSDTPEKTATSSEKWVENPYLKENQNPNYTFNINTVLHAGMPIQDITCNSHKTNISFAGKNTGIIQLDKSEKFGGNKDYILKYRLSGGRIESGLLLYEGENMTASGSENWYQDENAEKFFLIMMQPPKAPDNDQIPPREYVFIVDVSGSMNGFPLEISKKLLKDLISKLRPSDRFNVMLFESSNQMLSPESMPATSANIDKAIDVIDKQRGSGGTRLLPALKNALEFKETVNFSRTFVVLTDGYVTVEREAFDLIRNNLNKANLFAFGIGTAVNRFLIEGMANVGMGEPFILTNPKQATEIGDKFRRYIQNPVLTNIKIDYEGFEVYDAEPTAIPDVFAERPIIIYGKYKGSAKGKITLSGLSGNKTYQQTINVSEAVNQNNQAIRYLWARNKIRLLDDYNKLSVSFYNGYSQEYINEIIEQNPTNADRIKEVTKLGLKYNLLTSYTSFVAIDSEVRNKNGEITTVKQPLPLPEGVNDNAIGRKDKTLYRSYNGGKGKDVKKSLHTNFSEYSIGDIGKEKPKKEPALKEEEKTDDGFFAIVEQQAEPEDGMFAFYHFINKNIQYPEAAKKAGIKGKVTIQFTVNADGSLSDFKILKGLAYGCDEEAIRVLKLSKKWKAAKHKGKTVKSKMTLEIEFKG